MTEFEEYKGMVLNKTLTNLFFTKQDGPHDYLPGIFPAYYFLTVMELDHNTKLRFDDDFIIEWTLEDELITLTHDNWGLPDNLVFHRQKITDVTKDEYGHLTFHLENGTTIAHTIDYGDKLYIENPAITDDEKQEPAQHITPPAPKTWRTWLEKFFGF